MRKPMFESSDKECQTQFGVYNHSRWRDVRNFVNKKLISCAGTAQLISTFAIRKCKNRLLHDMVHNFSYSKRLHSVMAGDDS